MPTGSNVGFGMNLLTLPADDQALLAVELCPLDGALPVLRLDVAGERVQGLVVVVVTVEELEPELSRHRGRVLSAATFED